MISTFAHVFALALSLGCAALLLRQYAVLAGALLVQLDPRFGLVVSPDPLPSGELLALVLCFLGVPLRTRAALLNACPFLLQMLRN